MKKEMIISIAIVLIIVNTTSLISGVEMLTSNAGVQYEDSIIKEFEGLRETNQTFVKIIIDLKNISEVEDIFSAFSKDEIGYIKESSISSRISARITEQGFNKLIKDERVDKIYYNAPIHAFLDDSAPLINVTYAWNTLGFTGGGIKVCVVDSGVDKYHPALFGKVVAEKCYCEDNCCPNGSVTDNNASDDNGHGTHVIGIIASQNETYRGIAYDTDIYAVKIIDSEGNGVLDDVGEAIEWCISQGVDIISMSLGGGGPYNKTNSCPQTIDININNATNHNISIIIASGNEFYTNGIAYPACQGNVTSVGATTKQDTITDYTNRWSNLDLLAPGGVWDETPAYSEIVSTFSQRVRNDNDLCFLYEYYWWWPWWPFSPYCRDDDYNINGYFIRASGTSQATPMVAGAAALLLEKDSSLTPDEIKNILKDTGINVYDPDTGNIFKRIDVATALNSVCVCTSWANSTCGGANLTCSVGEREQIRNCDLSECDNEVRCIVDDSCSQGGGGSSSDITVCASGCNFTSIQPAINASHTNNRIKITDSRTYNEKLILNSTTAPWIECTNGAIIDGTGISSDSIYFNDVDGPVVMNCYITAFSYGIWLVNSTYGLIRNNTFEYNNVGIQLDDNSHGNKIELNNIQENNAEGIKLKGYEWSDVSYNNLEENNLYSDNYREIYLNYGIYNEIRDNNISDNTDYGIYIWTNDWNSFTTIENNFIFNNERGILIDYSEGNEINENIFCSSSTIVDIQLSGSSATGDENKCEKPGSWNDTGTTGCTYYCDALPAVTLLYPPNNFVDVDGNVSLVCKSTDDRQLVNVTLYHDISGTWQANQTRDISGTSNTTTFNIDNIPEYTFFKWNCLAYDNYSRSSSANANWTVNITNLPPTTPLTLLCDGEPCINNGTFKEDIEINCSGSSDNNAITYFIDAYYNHSGSTGINYFNNTLTSEELNFTGNENTTRYLEVLLNANVSSAYMNLSGLGTVNEGLKEGLVVYYRFDETSGNIAKDEIGTTYFGGENNITITPTNYDLWNSSGKINGKADFNLTYYGQTLGNISIDGSTNSVWSVNFFGNIDSTGGTQFFLGLGDTRFGIDGGSKKWYVENPSSSALFTASNNNFNMHTIVYNGTDIVWYINGTSIGSDTNSYISGTNFKLYLASKELVQAKLKGSIDELGIWNRTLNSSELSDLWNNGAGLAYDFDISPSNPYLEIGTPDGVREWQFSGKFSQTNNKTSDLFYAINSALNNRTCDCNGCVVNENNCSIPFLFHSDSIGVLEYDGIEITYNLKDSYFWESIGNHLESSVFNWNVTNIIEQSEIDLRCKSIDLQGSNIFSNYYDPDVNITISYTISNPITTCTTLDTPDTTYTLISNITNNTLTTSCIIINASNVTLDCKGYAIKTSPENYRGVYSDKEHTTIKNCIIDAGNYTSGIFLYQSNYSEVSNSVLEYNYHGLLVQYSLFGNFYNIVSDKNFASGIALSTGSSNNVVRDSSFNNTPTYYVQAIGDSVNNSFVNVSYNLSQEYVSSGSSLTRKYYYQAYVNDSFGNLIDGANVSAYSNNGSLVFSGLMTNASGYTSIGEIIDYVNYNGTRNYYSLYTITADNGSLADSHSYNVSLNKNNFNDVFSLSLPNDFYKFYIKNSAEEPVAWLGDKGNIILNGNCFSGGNCNAPGDDSFIILNSSDDYIAFINSTGDMCISSGDCSDYDLDCNNPTDSFAVKNSSDAVVSYLNGSLCLTGRLYENIEI